MINRFAFAAVKGILCHFPGEKERGRGKKKLQQITKRKRKKVRLGEGGV